MGRPLVETPSAVQKPAEPIEMLFGVWTPVGRRKHVLNGGAHWRHMANPIGPSVRGGDAAFSSNYLDHAF